MTDKRKKLARKVAKKTGTSYAGAINQLNGKLRVVPAESLDDVFAVDVIPVEALDDWRDQSICPEKVSVGTFQRRESLPVYDKHPDATAFIISEDGESILAVRKPKQVIVPLFDRSVAVGGNRSLRDMKAALIQVAAENCEGPIEGSTDETEVDKALLNHFQGQKGVIRKLILTPSPFKTYSQNLVCGVLNHAGVQVRSGSQVGLITFSDRVKGFRLRAS